MTTSTIQGSLFDTSDFPRRWECGVWTDIHGWTHIGADLLTAASYFAIPVLLWIYRRKRPEAPFPVLLWLFSAFILSCGTVHAIEATIFWHPIYRVSALFKVLTALVSVLTVAALVKVMPRALELPGLASLNAQLRSENTRRQAVEVELRKRNSDLQDFAYVASHDLRSPLRGIDGLAQCIQDDAEPVLNDESKDHLARLRSRVQRMDALLDSLLQYAQSGQSKHEAKHVDLGEVAREQIHLLDIPKGGTVTVEDMPEVTAIREPIELALRNLLSNALKHHDRDHPTVTVRGHTDGKDAVIHVTDDGPGIPEEFSGRVFELFQTLRPQDEVEGSGMGLAIVRRTIEAIGGSVELLAHDGRGATFELRIPATAQATAPSA